MISELDTNLNLEASVYATLNLLHLKKQENKSVIRFYFHAFMELTQLNWGQQSVCQPP